MKKFMVFIIPIALILSLAMVLPGNNLASAAMNDSKEDVDLKSEKEKYKTELSNLTEEEISKNFTRIDEEYDIGQEFSLKDQVFIEMYATPTNPDGITLFKTKAVNKSKTFNGITVTINGSIYDDIQNIINQGFGASNLRTRTTAGASKVTSLKTVVHHNAYGLVGSNGAVGKVYSGTLSANGKNNTIDGGKRYNAIVAYATTWVTATVTHSGGTFYIE